MVRIAVGDQNVRGGQRSDIDQVGATKLGVVRDDDQPVGGADSRPFHRAFLPVIVGEAVFGVDPGDAHHEGVAVVAAEEFGGFGADETQFAGTDVPPGQQDRRARFVNQFDGNENARGDHGQFQATAMYRPCDSEGGTAAVQKHRFVCAQPGHGRLGDVFFADGFDVRASPERWLGGLAQRDRAAYYPPHDALGLQEIDIPADGHLRDAELGGEGSEFDLPFRKNPLADESLPLADVNGHRDHSILSDTTAPTSTVNLSHSRPARLASTVDVAMDLALACGDAPHTGWMACIPGMCLWPGNRWARW